ncbi:Choline transport protein [Penicillium subrubescens]|uniref:Choline transport protein n=1 Tax=Penicillium subrubescens TaxID=1316194 RepID=A0A1Q5UM29_9EURO|nr:Choline transport protein [Penicillium subrubescens]
MANSEGFEMSRLGVKSAQFSEQRMHSRSGSDGGYNGGVTTSMSSGKRLDFHRSGFEAGLVNGGPAGLVWGMVLSLIGTTFIMLSLAEMSSMTPLAGAQYHWTAVLAPPRVQAFSTWIQGWITVFGWQASTTSICYLVAAQIQGMVLLNDSDYIPKQWHGTLIMWAIILGSGLVNIYGIKIMPALQMMGGILHITLFIALVVPIILLSRRSTSEFVFTELLTADGGWESPGIAWCLGMLTVTYCFLGFDGAIHMSEEVRNPAVVIPRVLVQTIAINGVLAFVFLLVILFCIGSVKEALSPAYMFPIIGIFKQSTNSVGAATAMQTAITGIGMVSNVGVVASVSRLTWAFARDGGLPFSSYFSHVDRQHRVPKRAILLVCAAVVVLSVINVASETALSAILALSTSSLYVSYLIPIVMMIIRRLDSNRGSIPFGPWNLGRFGMAINVFSLVFGVFVCIFVPFPTQLPVTAANMNWSGPVFIGVCLLLVIDWTFRARHKFIGPTKDLLHSKSKACAS